MPSALAAAVARNPGGPLLTQHDLDPAAGPGGRVELSAATLANWVAKTANLLRDDAAAGPGDRAAVLLRPHWQTAGVLLGCWAAGLAVAHGPRGGAPTHADVAFTTVEEVPAALDTGAADVYAVGLSPLGTPLADLPAGTVDYSSAVRGQADRYAGPPVPEDAPSLVGALGPGRDAMSHAELVEAALERAGELGLGPNARLLVDVTGDRTVRPLDWLAAPLAAGASVVLVRGALATDDVLAALASTERVTAGL